MTLTVQFYTMLAMVGMGLWLGAAVDTYRRFMHSHVSSILLFLCDILFWIVQGLFIFYVLLSVNDGTIRFYVFVALLCGFAMYRALFQTLYLQLLNVCIRLSIRIFHISVNLFKKFIVYPIKALVHAVVQILSFLLSLLMNFCLFIFRLLVVVMKGFGRLVWTFVPKLLKIHLKKLAGILKIVQNKIINYFGKR